MKNQILALIAALTVVLSIVILVKTHHIQVVQQEQQQVQIQVQPQPQPQVQVQVQPQVQVQVQPQPQVRPQVQPQPQVRPRTLPRSYQEALNYMGSEKILLVFTRSDCPACRDMRPTFVNSAVRQTLADNGVCLLYFVNVNAEPLVAQRYQVGSIPSYCIIDNQEKVYRSGVGLKDSITFIQWILGQIND